MSEATKYSVDRSATWKWVHERGNPMFTDHALNRYDERSPDDSISLERAWEESVSIDDILPWFERQSKLTDRFDTQLWTLRTHEDFEERLQEEGARPCVAWSGPE